MTLITHPTVRLLPHKSAKLLWVAEHLADRKRFTLEKQAAATLVLASGRQRVKSLSEIMKDHGITSDPAQLCANLYEANLLVEHQVVQDDERTQWILSVQARWQEFGWAEAADYHALTYDYPCIDYTDLPAATAVDNARMYQYVAEEPDLFRHNDEHSATQVADLPDPLSLDNLQSGVIDQNRVSNLISLIMGVTGMSYPKDSRAAPTIKRSSPSGGGRHPSELYLFAINIEGLPSGIYHVSMVPFSLVVRSDLPSPKLLAEMFPRIWRQFGGSPDAVLSFTSVFERNMYRYREPRTYRTVHMDAGHLAGTAKLLCDAMGWQSVVTMSDKKALIEEALEVAPLVEGYMLSVGLLEGKR